MTLFRPCIDLHNGKVKQIVGSTLSGSEDSLLTNFVSDKPAEYFADLYRQDRLQGGHVIMLGDGNESAALAALRAYPGGLHVGGGISPENAERFLTAGAGKVIVTSYIFPNGEYSLERLKGISAAVGRENLVIDLSCYKQGLQWQVAVNRWNTLTDLLLSEDCFEEISAYCSEFLVHSAGVEGKKQGIDEELVSDLCASSPVPITYAGGAGSIDDLRLCDRLSCGKVDLTIGSALDIFGGNVSYRDCVEFNRKQMGHK